MQGIINNNGTVTLTATQQGTPLFTPGSTSIEVVPAAVSLVSLPAATTVSSANSAFYVTTGVLNASGSGIAQNQSVNPAGVVHVLITSSNASSGQLVTTTVSGGSVTVDVPLNGYYTPMTKVAGGVEFDPVALGMTTITTQVSGFNNTWAGSSLDVYINP